MGKKSKNCVRNELKINSWWKIVVSGPANNRQCHLSDTCYNADNNNDVPNDGCYIAEVRMPYNGDQVTIEFYAESGMVIFHRVCYHGHDRAKFTAEAFKNAIAAK